MKINKVWWWVAIGLLIAIPTLLIVVLLLLSSELTDKTRKIIYTQKTYVEFKIPLKVKKPLRAFINGKEFKMTKEGVVMGSLEKLPLGESKHNLRLDGGLFSRKCEIALEITYYPSWEIRQFPDSSLENINPYPNVIEIPLTGDIRTTVKTVNGKLTYAVMSNDKKYILSGNDDGKLELYDKEHIGETPRRFDLHDKKILCACFSPDNKKFVSASSDNTLVLWNIKGGSHNVLLQGHYKSVRCVAFSPDGKMIVSGSDDKTLRLWDAETGEYMKELSGHTGAIMSVAFSFDSKSVASGGDDKVLKIWDVKTGTELQNITEHTDDVISVAFSPTNSEILAAVSKGAIIKIWNVKTKENIEDLVPGGKDLKYLNFSVDGRRLIWYGKNKVKIWDTNTWAEIKDFRGHNVPIMGVKFSHDGKTVLSEDEKNTIKFWNVENGICFKTSNLREGNVCDFTFSPDGKKAISINNSSGKIFLWDLQTEGGLEIPGSHPILSAFYSPDTNKVIVAYESGRLEEWDLSKESINTYSEHGIQVSSVAFSQDGKLFVSGHVDGAMKIWDVRGKGKEIRAHNERISDVAFSSDGKTIMSGSDNETLVKWNIETNKYVNLSEKNIWGSCVAFSPDGTTFVSGSKNGTLKLIDLDTLKIIRNFNAHEGPITDVSFSSDGKTIISSSDDGTLKLWWAAIVEPE